MKIKTFAVILLIFAIMLPLSARADTVSMTFTGVNGESSYGYYIDPYYATVGGVANTQIWCVDFNHDVTWGQTWTANVTPVAGTDYSKTYLNTTPVAYLQMAWLIQQYTLPQGPDPNNQKAAIQWLIWDISSGQHHSSYYLDEYSYWAGQLKTGAYANGDYSGWVILSDIKGDKDTTSAQEFMTKVPEPSILLLLGSGLVGLWGFRRKLRK